MDENGSPVTPGRNRFGPEPAKVLLPEVADQLLTLWYERAPAMFGAYLAEVLTGTGVRFRAVKGREPS